MISAALTCAGNGYRFGHNKLMMSLCGKPVFIRTIEQFYKSKAIDEIIVAARKEEIRAYQRLIKKENLKAEVIEGGLERHISAYKALKKSKGDFVLIHDGARPLVSCELIRKVVREVKKYKAVMTATATQTCIKYVKKNCTHLVKKICSKKVCQKEKCPNYSEGSYVEECLPRENTWLGQTPHAFKREIILRAYEEAFKDNNFIGMDDCDFVSRLGIKVKIIPGEQQNIKITIPQDLIIAKMYYKLNNGGKYV